MKAAIPLRILFGVYKFLSTTILLVIATCSNGQCPAGSNLANVNWDNLDYLVTTGNYTGYVTAAMSRTQAFALGVNRVEIVYPATITTSGENNGHTAVNSTDVQYNGSGNLVFTFDNVVNNFRFFLYDIDISQRVNVSALNAAATAIPVAMTKPAGGTVTITGSPGTNPQGQAPATAHATTSNLGTIEINITGPVKTVTVQLSGTAGDFWLSGLQACVTGTFPVNYFIASRPFTNQPTYVIGTSDTNTVSLINVTTGQAKMIFQDVTSPRYINGIGYDHLQHDLYYVVDFTTNPAVNKTIKRYNFDTETMSVLVPNVNTLGIPTFNRGVESAGCAFYDNDLYFGVEGNLTPSNNSGRETIIWRIEFDVPGGNAIKACQVYATPSDNGSGTSMHDWNDFTIADGILVDFAGAPTASQRRYTHYDLQTQTITNNYYTGGATPRQAGITWNDTRYWVYNTIAVYNENGTTGPQTTITGATALDWFGFCGDATGFRPKSDFGDAPSTFDPDPLSPALHEKDTALRLGPTWDQEFNKIASVTADADGSDEDAIATVQILDTATTTFVANITVYNNTGQTARVGGWLDINSNGIFEAGEGRIITVPHGGPVLQSVTLSWLSVNTPLDAGQYTYLRIRVTRTSSAMTVNNGTGYYNNGEVEDYRVFVDAVLPVSLIDFKATPETGTKVRLEWNSEHETNIDHYLVQRSADGSNWQSIDTIAARNQPGMQYYVHTDANPLSGKSFYRLNIINYQGGFERYSQVRQVQMGMITKTQITIMPNPVRERLILKLEFPIGIKGSLQLIDGGGRVLYAMEKNFTAGSNHLTISEVANWPAGLYYIRINTAISTILEKFSK